jgi:hypothetical protein
MPTERIAQVNYDFEPAPWLNVVDVMVQFLQRRLVI